MNFYTSTNYLYDCVCTYMCLHVRMYICRSYLFSFCCGDVSSVANGQHGVCYAFQNWSFHFALYSLGYQKDFWLVKTISGVIKTQRIFALIRFVVFIIEIVQIWLYFLVAFFNNFVHFFKSVCGNVIVGLYDIIEVK